MRSKILFHAAAICGALIVAGMGVSCSGDPKAAPTKAEVTLDPNLYTVEHPDLFKVARVETRDLPTTLNANGGVTPDINSTIHVTSQGSGRVVELKVRLGDYVKKGQFLLSIRSADLAGAFSDYRKAAADERLAQKALGRAQLLYSHGALAEKDLQQAEDTEEKAKVDVQNTGPARSAVRRRSRSSQCDDRTPRSGVGDDRRTEYLQVSKASRVSTTVPTSSPSPTSPKCGWCAMSTRTT